MAEIAPFSSPGQFYKGNLHTHSNLSDGVLPLEEVVNAYRDRGYDFLQMSEHFVQNFDYPIADTRPFRGNAFTTILGAELHAPETSTGELWHILAAGLPLDFEPPAEDESGPALARRAADAGAFIAIAHPSWSQLTLEDGNALDFADAVEVYNHGCFTGNDRGDGWYLMDQMLRQGYRMTAIATDDAHFGCDDAFGGWVHVKSESLEPEALLAGLKAGQFYSSQGPQIHELTVTKDEVHIVCSPVDTVTVLCGSSRAATRQGSSITEATLNISTLHHHWTGLKDGKRRVVEPVPWIRVALVDHGWRRAWTNPIWLDEL
ncbi:MAG: CehA/McbA family metallohydrolase [Pseudomonadota bacterium]